MRCRPALPSPHLGNLRVLDLTENLVFAAGIDGLAAASKSLPNLEAVGLQLNRAKDPTDRLEYEDTTPRYIATDDTAVREHLNAETARGRGAVARTYICAWP